MNNSEVVLVLQPHGGALLSGGMPGNRGGPGRPRSDVRMLCRQGLEDAVPTLRTTAKGEGEGQTASEAVRAFEALAKVCLPEVTVSGDTYR
jgi:hypothetical protein